MTSAKDKSAKDRAPIDPAGEDVVLEYTGPGHVDGVPARDLIGGDVARIAWTRAHRVVEWERPDAENPGPPTASAIAKVADELVATGIYQAAVATTTEPATPAESPEADK